jgi:signal transduction histidine kinase
VPPLIDFIPQPALARRSRRVVALIVGFSLLSLFLALSNLRALTRTSAGFIYEQRLSARVVVHTITAEAQRELGGRAELYLQRLNGEPIYAQGRALARVAEQLRHGLGEVNDFELVDSNGQARRVTLPVSQPALVYLLRQSPERVLFPLVGLLYLALGLWVWWKRPEDRAATSLLMFTLVAAFTLELKLSLDPLARWMTLAQHAVFPFYAPTLINFGIKFTGFHQSRSLQRLTRLAFGAACALALSRALYTGTDARVFQWTENAIGALLCCGVLIATSLGIRVARSQSPIALRRRGRLLTTTCLVAFFIPSLSVFTPPISGKWAVVVALLTAFPVAMAYAMIRHGVFNFRIVLRQGLVYALLSVSALLGYLGLVLLVYQVAERSLPTPALLALVVSSVVLVLSLLQLRLQGAINRFVFRSRYLFSDAIAQASAKLASAKTRAAVTDAVRSALIGQLRLARAALAISQSPGNENLECISLGGAELDADEALSPLPCQLSPSRLAPVRRALASQAIVTAYDSAAASAQVARGDRASAPAAEPIEHCDEGTFWTRYGLEAVMPLSVGTGSQQSRIVGCLLLGPKLDGKPLDSNDEHLIFTLANQLAVAIENTAAFEEIRSLKDNLEQQVQERTRDLSSALSDLKRAQGQLIESEKQAMLGRLVAGMAHEVNTPLGTLRSSVDTVTRVIAGYRRYVDAQSARGDREATLLARSSSTVDGLLQVMASSTERLNQLVGSLKRFVSLDQATHQRLDIRDSIDSALAVLGPSLSPQITIRQNYVDSDLRIKGDPAKLNQLFWDLLQNSLTALNGKGEIRIDARRDAGQIRVDLSDNGVGMPEERLHEVFDFGFTHKNGRVGLRLGLPTSKLTIDELGGEITIHSVPGEGTSVHLRLPG